MMLRANRRPWMPVTRHCCCKSSRTSPNPRSRGQGTIGAPIVPWPRVDVRRLLQKLHKRSAEQERGRTARLIVEKLRYQPRSPLGVRRLDVAELRALLARLVGKAKVKADLSNREQPHASCRSRTRLVPVPEPNAHARRGARVLPADPRRRAAQLHHELRALPASSPSADRPRPGPPVVRAVRRAVL